MAALAPSRPSTSVPHDLNDHKGGSVSDRNPYSQKNDGGWCECSVCGRVFTGITGFDAHHITTTGQPGYAPVDAGGPACKPPT